MELKDSICTLPGVAKQRQLLLSKLNIFTLQDLVLYFPRSYQDRSNIVNISETPTDEFVTIKGCIVSELQNTRINGKIITKGKITDGISTLDIVWFNQPYLKNNIKKNIEYIFSGNIIKKFNKRQLESPDFELFKGEKSLSFGRIIPIYPSTYGLSQKILRNFINVALKEVSGQLIDFIPKSVEKTYGLISRESAINNIHFPENNKKFFEARNTLVFTELFTLQLALTKIKGFIKSKSVYKISNPDFSRLPKLFPFPLTKEQEKVMNEISKDLKTGYVMNRLIQGDVGSGKTAIAILTAYLFLKRNDGLQVALMAPTEVLAMQHYNSFKNCFDTMGIETVLLSGHIKKKEKIEISENIQNSKYKMIIGTHAIIQENVNFQNLALVITDEQHRFGVRQRGVLAKKGENPHVLVMTATPIPRTLGLILYGDLDISTINTLPPGRVPIETYSVNSKLRDRVHNFIKNHVEKGRQAYIICPTIEESETIEMQSVLDYTEKLKNKFNHLNVSCLHGKMKPEEKQDLMNNYTNGNIDILVSTTVIEVGVNVPNATVMVIENSERFGLSALHQLRGRVGRGEYKSYCILITDSKSNLCKERIKAMTSTNDGFVISELDLKLRGPGDFFGTLQHGLPEFKIANLFTDLEILKNAQEAALKIFNEDIKLESTEYLLLDEEIKRFLNFETNGLPL